MLLKQQRRSQYWRNMPHELIEMNSIHPAIRFVRGNQRGDWFSVSRALLAVLLAIFWAAVSTLARGKYGK